VTSLQPIYNVVDVACDAVMYSEQTTFSRWNRSLILTSYSCYSFLVSA